MSALARIRRLPLLAETAFELTRAQAALRLRPFARIAAEIALPLRFPINAEFAGQEAAREVRGAVHAVCRRLPKRPTCLVRALAAHRMLRRRGVASAVVLSVAPGEGMATVQAHAWLEAATVVVTGSWEQAQFTPIHRIFPGAAQATSLAAAKGSTRCLL